MKRTREINIFFDIETIPAQSEKIKNHVQSNISPPANYKKPEVISAWIEENRDAMYRKTALNGGFGQIVCIGYAVNDNPVKVIYSDEWATSESDVLSNFFSDISKSYKFGYHTPPQFIGHNIDNFDLRFIYQRAIILGIKPPDFLPVNNKVYNNIHIFDTMVEWSGRHNFVSLNDICLSLGISQKSDEIDGSKVWDFVQNGKMKEVAEYCASDVEKVRAIYKRMSFDDSAPLCAEI